VRRRIVVFLATTLSAERALSDIDTARSLVHSNAPSTIVPRACRSWHRRHMSWQGEIAALEDYHPRDLIPSPLPLNISFCAYHLHPRYPNILCPVPRYVTIRFVTAVESMGLRINVRIAARSSKTILTHRVTTRAPIEPDGGLTSCHVHRAFVLMQ
jgi:hypothetical protein